jgi:intracellular multiplication protein IcmL
MAVSPQKDATGMNVFYRRHYNSLIAALVIIIAFVILLLAIVLYQVTHRKLPDFYAVSTNGRQLDLAVYNTPNQSPDTIIRWASRAVIAAYTFSFVNYNEDLAKARPYFTPTGWNDFRDSMSSVVDTVVKNQLFVSGVIAGQPVISNEGELPGEDYVWRVQIPFKVSYQSSDVIKEQNYLVSLTIAKVSTAINPSGMGIDQFVMTK